jgi:uncharacterized protein
MTTEKTTGFFGGLTRFLVSHRLTVLLCMTISSMFFGYYASKIQLNSSNEYYFLANDEFLVRYEDFKETFGSDEYTYAVLTFDDVFTPESLKELARFVEVVKEEVPYILSIQSILNVDHIKSDDASIIVEPFLSEADYLNPKVLAAKTTEAMNSPSYVDFLISKNRKFAGVFIEHEVREGDGEFRKTICDRFRAVADRPEFAGLDIKLVGSTILDADVDTTMAKESRFFSSISFALIFLVILVSFKNFSLVVAPFVVILVTDLWVLGLMSLLGYPLTMMSLVLPSVVVVVGCGDAIHFISEFMTQMQNKSSKLEALSATADLTGLPCLFTSLTTMVGFGSLMAMELRPGKEMGMFAAIGVVIAFVMTFVLLPTLLSFGSTRADGRNFQDSRVRRFYSSLLEYLAGLPVRATKPIVLVSGILFCLSLWGLTKIEVSADFLRVFDESTRIRQDYEYVDQNLGGTSSFQIVFDTKKTDGIFDPEALAQIDSLNTWLKKRPEVKSTQSVLEVFKELRKIGHDGDANFYGIPESRKEAAQLFLLYEMGGAERVEKILTDERDRARMVIRTKSISTAESEVLITETENWARSNLKDVKVQTTGMSPLFVRMIHFITRSQVMSFGLAFTFVTLCMILVFRSFRMGLLAMVPNIFPIALTFGFMGWFGITLNLGTVMIASIAIGIAVDDSIHFVSHYQRNRAQGKNTEAAIYATTTGVGLALLNTSVVLALGFSVFGLSDISHLVNFGLLTALTVVTALLADFLLLPAVLLLFVGRDVG